jgi:hypothetical protein
VVGDDTQSMLLQDMADEDEWASRPGTPRHELLKQEVVRQQQQQELAKRPLPKLRRAVTRQLATKMITGANKQLRSMRELHEGQIAAERESARAAGMDGAPAREAHGYLDTFGYSGKGSIAHTMVCAILGKSQYCTYCSMCNTCRKDSIAHTSIRSIADTWTGPLFGLARTEVKSVLDPENDISMRSMLIY